jgi:hypothetical protein
MTQTLYAHKNKRKIKEAMRGDAGKLAGQKAAITEVRECPAGQGGVRELGGLVLEVTYLGWDQHRCKVAGVLVGQRETEAEGREVDLQQEHHSRSLCSLTQKLWVPHRDLSFFPFSRASIVGHF